MKIAAIFRAFVLDYLRALRYKYVLAFDGDAVLLKEFWNRHKMAWQEFSPEEN